MSTDKQQQADVLLLPPPHTHKPILATSLFTGPSTPIKSPVSPSKPDHRLPACYHTLFTDFITEREGIEREESDEMIGGVVMLS